MQGNHGLPWIDFIENFAKSQSAEAGKKRQASNQTEKARGRSGL
jgi:hypothetical protein